MSSDVPETVEVHNEPVMGEASTSSARQCEVCGETVSKYTCPRCETKICSLECTKTHKIQTSCSGIREKTDYVPMNTYNDVAMWRDLAFLRDVGDKVKDWGGALNLPSQEAMNRKERQLAGNRKGKQREDSNGRSAVVHDRLKNLSKRELALRRTLMQNGIEILFLPKEMERHKANKTSYNAQKKKLAMTISVHTLDHDKKRSFSKTMHDNSLETRVLDIVKKAYPDLDPTKHIVLLPVPVRPVVFSKNAPFPEKKRADLPSPPTVRIPKAKSLPKAHASLPMKPTWIEDTPIIQPSKEPTPEVEPAPPKRDIPKPSPREVWLVEPNETLKEALKGTSILEWPEFEIWPEELARGEVEAERLEYIERRRTFDRADWKRKREANEDHEEGESASKKTNYLNEDEDSSDSDTTDSETSSSLSSTDSIDESEEDLEGDAISQEVAVPLAVPTILSTTLPPTQPLRGLASLPPKPPVQL